MKTEDGVAETRWRFLSTGIGGWLALLLAATVAAVVAFGFAAHWVDDRVEDIRPERVPGAVIREVRRARDAIMLLERTPPDGRKAVLRAVNGPLLRIRLVKDPPRWRRATGRGEFGKKALKTVRRQLGPLADRRVRIRFTHRAEDGDPEFPPHRRAVLIAVPLADGSWARAALAPVRRGPGPGILFWLGLTVSLVLAVAIWTGYRLTRPLRRLAAAADRFGRDEEATALPERGPREIRNAVRSFNRMTVRIRRLVDERALFTAALSHDLKTMLTRLRLRAEFMDDPELRQKTVDDVEDMRAILDETLVFIRDDAYVETSEPVDLAALLDDLCSARGDLGQPVSRSGPAQLIVPGRPVALRRCFDNLIENAIAYGGEAEITLSAENGDALVRIVDQGPGIPPQYRDAVFQPFFRVETSRSRQTGGTGLGLAVVRAVIDRHGGDISFVDRREDGFEVRVRLPASGGAS